MAVFPWTQGYDKQGMNLDDFPNVKRWFNAIHERPAVKKALTIMRESRNEPMTEEAKSIMFGDKQYQRR